MPRGTVIRLITAKEFRDLIRDRRTVMLILILPVVVYPLFLVTGVYFARTIMGQEATVAVVGADTLKDSGLPPLLEDGSFANSLGANDEDEIQGRVVVRTLEEGASDLLQKDRTLDAAVILPPTITADLAAERRPTVTILSRDGDDTSKLAARRVTNIIRRWESQLREARFAKHGLPKDYDRVLNIEDPLSEKPQSKKAADELRDTFTRVFPFLLMMWLLAGAIQPAVDMTAGEKERGTMETLLISPVERTEIVLGKFFATTGFSFLSVVWNVIWLTGGVVILEQVLDHPIVNPIGLAGSVVLGLPLAMLFSAVCVALGVFAKSTKEGQYYLLPLILVVMPLAFWSMTPGMQLDGSNCWVPITGAMLFQRRLLTVGPDPVPWDFFAPVFGALAFWIVIALSLAVWQFHREGVLFREDGPKQKRFLGLFRRRTGEV